MEPTVSFSIMLQTLIVYKQRAKCRRDSWGEDEHIFIQYPDENSTNTQPYLFKVFSQKDGRICRGRWVPNQDDLFEDDWLIIYLKQPFDDLEEAD